MNKSINFDKLSQYNKPEESPGYLLWKVSTQWRSSIEDVLKPLDLTHPQFVVLAAVGWLTQKENRATQIEISRQAGLDPNTTSQVLRGLEAKNFIERVRSLDERSKNPILTPLGSQRLKKALPAVEKADTQFFSLLENKETGLLIKIFQKLTLKT